MQRDYPVGVAQALVLKALGLTATGFGDAQRVFDEIGLLVASKRVGRTTEPVVTVLDRYTGALNADGEGDSWQQYKTLDLSAIQQWTVR